MTEEIYSIPFDPKDKEVLGKGMTATVYGYGDKMAVKLYNPEFSEVAERELICSTAARQLGVPCPKVYMRVVSSDGRRGLVMDRLEGKTMYETILSDRANYGHYISLLKRFVQGIHKIGINSDDESDNIVLYDIKSELITCANQGWMDKKLIIFIQDFLDTIPNEKVFVHGDLGLTNMILCEDNIMMIDLCNAGFGPTIYNYASLYRAMIRERRWRFRDLPNVFFFRHIWRRFIKLSFPEVNASSFFHIRRKIEIYYAIWNYLFCCGHNKVEKCQSLEHELKHYMRHFDKTDYINLGI